MSKIVHYCDTITLRKSHLIICDTEADKEYFSMEFNIPLATFLVLYLKADVTYYDPKLIEKYYKNDNKLKVIYFGSILPLQGVEVILDTMLLLKDNKDIQFTIIGPIKIEESRKKLEFPNTKFISWLSQKELAIEIAKSDLCLAGHFHGQIGKAKRTIAGKTYIYKAMRKPVVLGDNAANRELFKEDHMNYFVKMGDAKALANLLVRIEKGGIKNDL